MEQWSQVGRRNDIINMHCSFGNSLNGDPDPVLRYSQLMNLFLFPAHSIRVVVVVVIDCSTTEPNLQQYCSSAQPLHQPCTQFLNEGTQNFVTSSVPSGEYGILQPPFMIHRTLADAQNL